MVQAWHATDGAFDPTLLGALVGLGYATSWDDPSRTSSAPVGVGLRGRPDLVGVDHDNHLVELPRRHRPRCRRHRQGLAADLVAEGLLARGAAGALVNIGGDVRVAGIAPRTTGWTVDVADPSGSRPVVDTVRLTAGSVASSGTDRRRWAHRGAEVHHLLDPSTGRPSTRSNDGRTVVGATVVAGTGAWAEAWTKVLMTRPTTDALAALDRHGLAGVVVHDDGTTTTSTVGGPTPTPSATRGTTPRSIRTTRRGRPGPAPRQGDDPVNEQTWWYLSRASGLVAWVLLVGSLIGACSSPPVHSARRPTAWLLAMHRWLSGLAVTATAVHLLALVFDGVRALRCRRVVRALRVVVAAGRRGGRDRRLLPPRARAGHVAS